MRRVKVLVLSAAVVLAALSSPTMSMAGKTRHEVAFTCPFSMSGGDQLSRGFYVRHYPADTIHSVTLGYTGSGTWTVTVTARKGGFDGRVLGRASMTFSVSGSTKRVTFPFGDVRAPLDGRIAFVQKASGKGEIFYDVGNGRIGDRSYDGCPGLTQTGGTAPPLGRFRRASVGVTIRALSR